MRRTAGCSVQSGTQWTPDGRWLVVADLDANDGENGLFLIGVESGERRTIVTAPLATVRYGGATVSPAGDAIAYVGCSVAGTAGCDLWLQPLGADLSPQGAARRLTDLHGTITGAELDAGWSLPGRRRVDQPARVRVSLAGPNLRRKPTRLDWAGSPVLEPTVSTIGRRLVATRDLSDLDIWRFDLSTPGMPESAPVVHARRRRSRVLARRNADCVRIRALRPGAGDLGRPERWHRRDAADAGGRRAEPRQPSLVARRQADRVRLVE